MLVLMLSLTGFFTWLFFFAKFLNLKWNDLEYNQKVLRVGRYRIRKFKNEFGIAAIVCGVLSGFIALILIVSYQPGLAQKIAMYQEENAVIEQNIAALVENYMEFEKGIVHEVAANESTMQLISLYPELTADELVKAQLETYKTNSAQIKQLKNSQINQAYWRWWAYFGE